MDAQFVSETIPATVAVGQTYTGTVTFENTGTTPWDESSMIRLAIYGNTANMGINGDTADMWYQMFKIAPTTTVQPGETYTWTFSFTPTNAGDFWLGYSMANEAQGLSFFGQAQATSNTVTSGMLDAQFVSETIPATVAVGQTYTGTVTFENTGTTPWDESSMIRLAMYGNTANMGINGDTADMWYQMFKIAPDHDSSTRRNVHMDVQLHTQPMLVTSG